MHPPNIAAYYSTYSSRAHERRRSVQLDLNNDGMFLGRFEIVHYHGYGILYHRRDPTRLVHVMNATCRHLCFVQTCRSFEARAAIDPTQEDVALASEAFDGARC